MANENVVIGAIIVTYNIGQSFLEVFSSVLSQVNEIVIIDNGSGQETVQILKEIEVKNPGTVKVSFNSTNLGLAAAQNLGLEEAVCRSWDWALFLDHDSVCDALMIRNMLDAYQRIPEKNAVGILAPAIFDVNTREEGKFLIPCCKFLFRRVTCPKGAMFRVLSVIASGSLVSMFCVKKIGGIRGDLFIDSLDSEFSLRALSNGFHIYAVGNARLFHKLGERKVISFLGIEFKPTFHTEFRRFFIYRNRIWIWKEFLPKVPSFVVFEFIATVFDFFRILFFEDHRKKKLIAAIRGIFSGILIHPNPEIPLFRGESRKKQS